MVLMGSIELRLCCIYGAKSLTHYQGHNIFGNHFQHIVDNHQLGRMHLLCPCKQAQLPWGLAGLQA